MKRCSKYSMIRIESLKSVNNWLIKMEFIKTKYKKSTFAGDCRRGADVACQTVAAKATRRVGTYCRRPTRFSSTLIYVCADWTLRFKPILTETLTLYALRVVHTVKLALAKYSHIHLNKTFLNFKIINIVCRTHQHHAILREYIILV